MDVYWIWLSEIKGIGPVMGKKLLKKFKTPKNIFNATYQDLINIEGIGEKTAELILDSKDETMKIAEVIMKNCEYNKVKILKLYDELYPSEVKNIKDSPIILYYSGNINNSFMGVGIVGSRRCTDYGKKVINEAVELLCKYNIPIISGMAKGIDGYAHTACINSGGYTIAFLGCGIDIAYPKEHIKLMEKIKETGVIISEYPPGTKPNAKNFPKRNRLIASFSKELLVVEAGENSGSLITAEYARKYERRVFAVPNNIYSKESLGSNNLILNGADIYISPKQLLEEYSNITETDIKKKNIVQTIKHAEIDSVEEKIIMAIEKGTITIDEIKLILNDNSVDILEKLSLMELDGKIKILSGRVSIIS